MISSLGSAISLFKNNILRKKEVILTFFIILWSRRSWLEYAFPPPIPSSKSHGDKKNHPHNEDQSESKAGKTKTSSTWKNEDNCQPYYKCYQTLVRSVVIGSRQSYPKRNEFSLGSDVSLLRNRK